MLGGGSSVLDGRSVLLSLVVALVAVAWVPASLSAVAAGGEDLPPLVHTGGAAAEGWVMYRYDAHGEHLVMDFEVPELSGTAIRQFGAMGYGADLEFLGGALLTKFYGDDGVYSDSRILGDAGPVIDTYDTWSEDGSTSIRIEMNKPGSPYETVTGERYTLIWGVGGIGEHVHSFRAAEGVELFEVEYGTDASLHVTQDLESAFAARASTGPVGARASIDGVRTETIEHNMVGIFEAGYLASPDLLTAEMANGTLEICTCSWLDLNEPYAAGPGEYTFRATGAVASINAADHVRLTVVDVRVPNQEA